MRLPRSWRKPKLTYDERVLLSVIWMTLIYELVRPRPEPEE